MWMQLSSIRPDSFKSKIRNQYRIEVGDRLFSSAINKTRYYSVIPEFTNKILISNITTDRAKLLSSRTSNNPIQCQFTRLNISSNRYFRHRSPYPRNSSFERRESPSISNFLNRFQTTWNAFKPNANGN